MSVEWIDLDHAATTPMLPEAVAAAAPFHIERAGNPSGAHRRARDAQRALDLARAELAACLGGDPGDVVFTGSGTEADNHAIVGGLPPRPGVPVCSAVEHHAVLDPTKALGGILVPVDSLGRVLPEELADVLDTAASAGLTVGVVSIMLANNEIGTVNDLNALARVARKHAPGAVLHTDAVCAFPQMDVRPVTAGIDLVSVSAHKFGGPKGVGVLMARPSARLAPMLLGGGQERGRRSGTQNVAGIVAAAAAASHTVATRAEAAVNVAALRDRLADGLRATIDGLLETAVPDGPDGRPDRSHKLPGNCHVCIDGVDSETLLLLLEEDGVLASAASSCASGAAEPSHVLAAIGVPESLARGAVRMTLGPGLSESEVDRVVEIVGRAVSRVRRFAGSSR